MNQHMRPEPVPFIDIAAQRRRLGKYIDEAVARVLSHCQFINGPEVTALEAALAKFSGARHVVSCASGTDALLMVLMAKQVGPGDAVLCPSFYKAQWVRNPGRLERWVHGLRARVVGWMQSQQAAALRRRAVYPREAS